MTPINRKIGLFCGMIVFISTAGMAQNRVNVSVQSGVSWSGSRMKNQDTIQANFGTVSGISFDGYVNRFSYGVDLLYKQIGFTYAGNFDNQVAQNPLETATTRFSLNYVSIPLKFWYDIPIGKTKYRGLYGGFIGICPSFFTSGKTALRIYDQNNVLLSETVNPLAQGPNRMNLAALFGAKLVFPIDLARTGKWHMGIYSSLEYGFKNITNDQFFQTGIIKLIEGQLRFVVEYHLK